MTIIRFDRESSRDLKFPQHRLIRQAAFINQALANVPTQPLNKPSHGPLTFYMNNCHSEIEDSKTLFGIIHDMSEEEKAILHLDMFIED
jgi:hypothetical protein